MTEDIHQKLTIVLEDWTMMQKTSGDEGAEWAERFEKHFYEWIEELKAAWHSLDDRPKTIEDAESLPEIEELIDRLPGPLQLNFLTELEEIVEGEESLRYD
ncbi:hypothetical protein LC040_08230 [Bacillus tianshenii]|nr:hypothetical protein LC040_08230 [Bacillus tianshenii]